jgi:predicted lipoprotein with Yx(FWY)xxD motif
MSCRGPIKFLATAGALPVVALVIAGCGGGSAATTSGAPAKTPSGQAATVRVTTNGSLGNILVDYQGRTLYLFRADNGTKSACTTECAVDWPPLRVSGKPMAGTGVAASKLGTSARSDGKPQVTYNGHPLYRFEQDINRGDANGEGLNAFGARWYVLSPAGTMVSGSAASSSSGGGGSGY